MKVILHLGFAKTGTTSLQFSLLQTRDELLRAGIYFPTEPGGAPNHHILQALDGNEHPMNWVLKSYGHGKKGERAARQWCDQVALEAKRSGAHTMILTSEVLFTTRSENRMKEIANWLRGFADEIIPVAYVRDPIGRFVSTTQENAKLDHRWRTYNYRTMRAAIELAERDIGRITLLPFERSKLIGGDVVRDFSARYIEQHLPSGLRPVADRNTSLSAEALLLTSEMNRYLETDKLKRRRPTNYARFDAVRKADQSLCFGDRRLRIKPEIAAQVLASSVDHVWLARERGISFASLDGVEVKDERPPFADNINLISDIFDYDPRRLAALAGLVSEQSIARQMAPTKAPTVEKHGPGFGLMWGRRGIRIVWARSATYLQLPKSLRILFGRRKVSEANN